MLGIEPTSQTAYGTEIAIMEHTGWSWEQMTSTPAAVIDEMIIRIEAREYWTKKRRALDSAGKA